MAAPAIAFDGVVRDFGVVRALDGLDLAVAEGTVFGFLGPNGAGKTTAIRILAGLDRPTSGSAHVLGFDAVTDTLCVRQRIGYLAQLPRFYDELTPRQTLRFSRRFFPYDSNSTVDRDVTEALDLVGLNDAADRRVAELSGGQRQRLGIAQATVHHPAVVILDEPASALDPIGRRDVLTIMDRLRGTTTVFFSTHILDDVQRISDHVAVLNHGKCVLQQSMHDALANTGVVPYRLSLTGDVDGGVARLQAQTWVNDVHVKWNEDSTQATVVVHAANADAADQALLRTVLAADNVIVHAFGRHRSTLEEVFLRAVGVLEWLLSKPLTHAGVVGAQFVAHGAWLALSMIAIPWLVVHALASVAAGSVWPVDASLGAGVLVALFMLFHLAFMLALGSFVTSRVTLLAIPLSLLVGIDLALVAAPQLAVWSPWSLGALAAFMFTDAVLIDIRPVLTAVLSISVLLLLAPNGLRHAMR